MNIDRIIQMVVRQIVRRGVNAGINAGVDAVSRRKGGGADTGQAKNTKKQIKQSMRIARRMGRF